MRRLSSLGYKMRKAFLVLVAAVAMLAPALAAHADPDTGTTPEIWYQTTGSLDDLSTYAQWLGNPVLMYEFLRNNAEYDLYDGSRSGSTNSFMGLRGNDVDLASTLIAMLRQQGYHARYAVGTIKVGANQLMNWLGVKNVNLAVLIMQTQGIQHVTLNGDNTVSFEHVWVEVQTPFGEYRSAGNEEVIANTTDCATNPADCHCTANPADCHWIALDASFKQRNYNDQGIDPYSVLSFDYTNYYNAIYNANHNGDTSRLNKNPLEIYQGQVLSWLQTNYPGKTLDDASHKGSIITEDNWILPASLPYAVIGSPRRYNSVADHDAAVPATEPYKWAKGLSLELDVTLVDQNGNSYPYSIGLTNPLPLAILATTPLVVSTVTDAQGNPNVILNIGIPSQGGYEFTPLLTETSITGYTPKVGDAFSLKITVDGPAGKTNLPVEYDYCTVGGYYLIATGGEATNWTQVFRAADSLLYANQQQFKIVYNAAESGCQPPPTGDGIGCTPYVDKNGNGVYDAGDTALMDDQQAMDSLTEGLLYVSAMQYYAQLRDNMKAVDALNHTITPISYLVGVVSATNDAVEYIDGTAFSILPGGLLLDMKGTTLAGSWRIDQPNQWSSSQFNLIGHISSSLEHETWQQLTGYDAVSTVRGIQMALANGASWLDLKKHGTTDTVQSMYAPTGFTSSAPSGFTLDRRSIYGTLMDSWWYATADWTQSFSILEKKPTSSTDSRQSILYYYNDTLDGVYQNPSSGYYYSPSLLCFYTNQNSLQSLYNTYGGNATFTSAGSMCCSSYYPNMPCSYSAGATISQAISVNQSGYSYYRASVIGATEFDYLDENKGFNTANFVFRGVNGLSAAAIPSYILGGWRNLLYLGETSSQWNEILAPSQMATGGTSGPPYRFAVDIWNTYDANNNMIATLFDIQNEYGVSAGGAYVPANGVIVQESTSITLTGGSNVVPTFNNAVLTDKNTIAQTNNDPIKTPSTNDPASTVTGNNYHDETDFVIKGRGINYAFTRTYNSASSSTTLDGPFGYGWTHSYNMKLKSNDYGACPNCTSAQAVENGNGKTSSITYTDERGGEHNYLVNESGYAVTKPAGEFDSLALDSPSAGYYTLTFRNGVQYVFKANAGANLKTTPGGTARLDHIQDPYNINNTLTFSYDGNGNLSAVQDNLGLSGRTGLAITYWPGTIHIKDITDWSGRKWSYAYDSYGNLQSVTNPLNNATSYGYTPANSHNLSLVTLPEVRTINGQAGHVTTSYAYYQNGKTFADMDGLGNTEILGYDLYRKITSVTDPRGYIRQYEFDQNGLLTKLTEPDGGIIQFKNTSDFLRYQKTDALGYNTTYSYTTNHAFNTASDTYGNVTMEQDPLNCTLQYTYGMYDQIATMKDKNGNTFTMSYYAADNPATGAIRGKLQSVTLSTLNGTSNVQLRSFTYNTDGTMKQMIEYIDPANSARQRITNYTWQDNGLNLQSVAVTGATQGGTVTTTYTYDNLGLGRKHTAAITRRKSATDPTMVTITTTYDYDNLDHLTRVTDTIGNSVETVYDANGKVTQVNLNYLQSDGNIEQRVASHRYYDYDDRLIWDYDFYWDGTYYGYDSEGSLSVVMDPNGNVTNYVTDPMKRRTMTTDANGNNWKTVYDQAGHPVQTINPLGKGVTTVYDALGRPTSVTDAMGFQTTLAYDANGNVTKMTDANANNGGPKNSYGCTLYKVYDELNRVKLEVDALNNQTSYTYDLLGNITSITDANSHTTYFDFDDLGRLWRVRDPLYPTTGKATTFTYDEAGNLLTRTNRSGAQAVFTYDLLNRQTNAQYTSSAGSFTETTTYDIYGNKRYVSNPDVTYHFIYDLMNRLSAKIDNRNNKTISFTYDNVGNIVGKQNYDGTFTKFAYDSTNRLVSEQNADFLEVSYHYDGAGRLLNRILSNGAHTDYTWDDGNRLATMSNTTVGGASVNSTSYVRDRLGNITSQTDASGTTSFVYDALYRLTNANYPGTTNDQSFTYDNVGNRKTWTKNSNTLAYKYDADNRLNEIHQTTDTGALLNSYLYDDDGNMTTKKNASGTVIQSLTFDAKGRAKSITTSGIGAVTQLTYDPLDYRIAKSDSKGNQSYFLEGERLDGIMSGSNWQARFMRGSVVDEVVNGFEYNTSGVWTNYTFHHDALQSVLGLSGHEGSVLQTISYGPFGDKISTTGTANNNYLHFTGREEDTDNGLYYFRARFYDPVVGRFITEDPKRAGINYYAYAQNNPINANDPMGLNPYVPYDTRNAAHIAAGQYNASLTLATSGEYGAYVYQLGDKWYHTPSMSSFITNEITTETWSTLQTFIPSGASNISRDHSHPPPPDWSQDPSGADWKSSTLGYRPDSIGRVDGSVISYQFGTGFNPDTKVLSSHTQIITQIADPVPGGLQPYNYLDREEPDYPTSFMQMPNNPSSNKADFSSYSIYSDIYSALGGFLIYPNKPNTNMMRSVYAK